MAAVTTDIPTRWRSGGGTCLLRPVPELPSSTRSTAGQPLVELVRPRHIVPVATYRLRRALTVMVLVGLVLAAWVVLEAVTGASGLAGRSAPGSAGSRAPITVDVRPGDTFWNIASRLQPEGDPRPLVDRLVAAHGGRGLQAGERLAIPRT